MSYSGNPASSSLDMVRFLLGDTDTDAELLTDQEIEALLTVYNDDVYATAVACAWSLAGKYARKVDRSVGDLRISYGQTADNFRALATQLENQGATSSEGFRPYAGGISISDKQNQDADTDRVVPAFKRGTHDDTGVVNK